MHAVYSVLQKRHKMTALKKKKRHSSHIPSWCYIFQFSTEEQFRKKKLGERCGEKGKETHISLTQLRGYEHSLKID